VSRPNEGRPHYWVHPIEKDGKIILDRAELETIVEDWEPLSAVRKLYIEPSMTDFIKHIFRKCKDASK